MKSLHKTHQPYPQKLTKWSYLNNVSKGTHETFADVYSPTYLTQLNQPLNYFRHRDYIVRLGREGGILG